MGNVYTDGKVSGPSARAKVWIRCTVSCLGKISVCLDLGYDSDVRAMAKLRFRFMLRHGRNRWYW